MSRIVKKDDEKRIEAFGMKIYRQILRVGLML